MSPGPDPDVAKMFGRYLRVWQEALTRWTEKCKGVQQERRTLQATGGLVAQAAPFPPPRRRINPVLADGLPPPGPAGLTPEVAERLSQLERRSVQCDKWIREIQQIIANLMEAQKTGEWMNRQQLWVGLHEQPKFISRGLAKISRGEKVVVLEVKGEWWRVRNSSGIEGWTHQGELAPKLPVEFPGAAAPEESPEPDSFGGQDQRDPGAGGTRG